MTPQEWIMKIKWMRPSETPFVELPENEWLELRKFVAANDIYPLLASDSCDHAHFLVASIPVVIAQP